MRINTNKSVVARFTLEKREVACLEKAAEILKVMARNLELATGLEVSAQTIGELLVDLTDPKTVEA